MNFTTVRMKAAWIKDGEVGKPSTGHFDCNCGAQIKDVFYADGDQYPCECGRVFDSKGWIVTGPEVQP